MIGRKVRQSVRGSNGTSGTGMKTFRTKKEKERKSPRRGRGERRGRKDSRGSTAGTGRASLRHRLLPEAGARRGRDIAEGGREKSFARARREQGRVTRGTNLNVVQILRQIGSNDKVGIPR